MHDTLRIAELQANVTAIAGRVQSAGTRIAVQKRGKIVAALVPPSDLEMLEALEDRLDLLDALDALADYRENGGSSLEDLKRDLGV
ncbi:MAG: type II toxin-antitoxin system Phd/YefM family antitoxin [Acidobacteriota bacterium]|nr:type II toxin-antitoxin system Phd/YefM family antitoxin [Acidobacteriota bacterium]MDE3263799.1 type II toxin-antitoxin system Phd/YefM family antitoxin [Acidobacteriota bacterium]